MRPINLTLFPADVAADRSTAVVAVCAVVGTEPELNYEDRVLADQSGSLVSLLLFCCCFY